LKETNDTAIFNSGQKRNEILFVFIQTIEKDNKHDTLENVGRLAHLDETETAFCFIRSRAKRRELPLSNPPFGGETGRRRKSLLGQLSEPDERKKKSE
jgi:hypothetical protein